MRQYPNPCPQCGAVNGSGCGHGLGGNQGIVASQSQVPPVPRKTGPVPA